MVSELEKAVRADLQALIKEKNCHGIMVRVAWHDAGTCCVWGATGWGRLAAVARLWLLSAVVPLREVVGSHGRLPSFRASMLLPATSPLLVAPDVCAVLHLTNMLDMPSVY